MAWFSRLRNWEVDEGNGIGIRADFHDEEDNNFAAGINLALNIAGGNSPTANIPMAGFRFTGAGAGVASGDFATLGQAQSAIASYAVDSSGSSAYAIAVTPVISTYTAGLRVSFKVGTSNLGAATLNVSGLGAKSIKKDKDTDLADNDLVSDQIHTVIYDGTNFQLQSPIYGVVNQNGGAIFAADAGASDTYAITLSPVPLAYATGMVVNFKANTANTGAATLNVNGLGAKAIKKDQGADLADNDIVADQIIQVIYDGTNFQLCSPVFGCIGQNGASVFAADAGASDAYVIALSPAPVAYTTGMMINFKANTANTGAATLNVNGLGAKPIKKNFNLDLANADILAGQINTVIYDGTNFQLPNATGTGSSTTGSSYVTMSSDGTLTAERLLTAGSGILIVDGGPGSTVTVNQAPGSVLQTLSTTITTRLTIASASMTDVSGLSRSITPASTSNKIRVSGHITLAPVASLSAHFRIVRGATPICVSTMGSPGSRIVCTGSISNSANTSDNVTTLAFDFLDSPSTTSATTYKIQATSGTAGSMAVNGSINNTDATYTPYATSTITVQEIKG